MPELVLEQKALGELPPGLEPELERLLAADDTAADRLADIERSNREILEQYPPGPTVAAIRRRAEAGAVEPRRARGWGLWLGLPAVAAAAAAVLLFVVPALHQPAADGPLGVFGVTDGPEVITVRGDARLKIYKKGSSEVLLPGAVVTAGDVLQVYYDAKTSAPHGAILSVDGRGSVSLHFPKSATGSTQLVPGNDMPLDHSFELDDAPRFERFFFFTSTKPIPVGSVQKALEALGKGRAAAAPRLPQGVVLQHQVLLRKRAAQVKP